MKTLLLVLVVGAALGLAGCAGEGDGRKESRISGRAGVQVTSQDMAHVRHNPPGPPAN